jgi:hypothetical protein
MTRKEWNPEFEKFVEMLYKQFVPYKNHQLQHNALQEIFTVLPNLIKQISLIFVLSILNISQPKHGFRSVLVSVYLPAFHTGITAPLCTRPTTSYTHLRDVETVYLEDPP